jgi:NADH dehydrogenase (ubiquinone) Fe-S protein 5
VSLLHEASGTHNSSLLQCYAQADAPSQCKAQAEDYLECLHRAKEVRPASPSELTLAKTGNLQIARAQEIKAEFVKQAKKHAHDRTTSGILSDGVIVGVGLIQRDH